MRRSLRFSPLASSLFVALVTSSHASVAGGSEASPAISLTPVDSEPRTTSRPAAHDIEALRRDTTAHPDDRSKRLALVRGLLADRELDGALAAAKAWRARDAYSLVAVRALGDVYMERGDRDDAERVYSAIVELAPKDPDAQRALGTLLKQRGDLEGARERLAVAVESRPGDARLAFELADTELRLGQTVAARGRFEQLVAQADASEQIRYPAKQRLGQLLGGSLRDAKAAGDSSSAKALLARLQALDLKGGIENDVHVYLTWDTDRTDVDLWVTTPENEKVFYGHRVGRGGEALYDDVTTGYGPESLTVHRASAGEYVVQVNYFSAGRTEFPEARGEVVVVLAEGRTGEQRYVLPYRLFAEKETVTVARVHVAGGR